MQQKLSNKLHKHIIAVSIIYLYSLLVCGTPSKPGYVLGTATGEDYGSTVPVPSCDTGYTGTVTTPQLKCLASGNWSDPAGCTIVGEFRSN